ncbi:hypothetical protein CJ030_MR5G009733 [Morella rubra]|uniref:Uncharacterized protein n=1 Tax=Morella rubra TaxID=262757 RepID=A0A6A1VIP8_9ROSI|nr:hypothetical protein CJ030_MR5G009733 [Morella rubra]
MASNAKRGRQGGSVSTRSGKKGRGSTPLPLLSSQPPLQETQLGSEDDSTQPSDAWLEQGGYHSVDDHQENDQCEGRVKSTSRAATRCHGKAKGTEFAKLRKLGRVYVSVPTGARGPSSNNALLLAARVSYIVRTFANMKYKCWTLVPTEDKDELYTWVLKVCQRNTLNRKKQKVPHTSGSKSLQNLLAEKGEGNENLIAFYKRSHSTKLDGKFINRVVEETYLMRIKETCVQIFERLLPCLLLLLKSLWMNMVPLTVHEIIWLFMSEVHEDLIFTHWLVSFCLSTSMPSLLKGPFVIYVSELESS